MEKLAFVIPWFGESIGGAEILCKGFAKNLHSTGYDVEVLTTCGKDAFSSWDVNHYSPGVYEVDGITVRRFPLDGRNIQVYHRLNHKLIDNERLTEDEAHKYLQNTINSQQLYDYIRENSDKYLFLFIPYLYGTTFYGSEIAPERSYHIPCLHNESNACLPVYKNMLSSSRGIFFLSKAEMNFAKKTYNLNAKMCFLLGGGVDEIDVVNPKAFRDKFGIDEDFVLFVGRKVEGKGAVLLSKYFSKFAKENHLSLKLVLIGNGTINISTANSDYVIDLGPLSDEDKHNAMGASLFLIQPSFFESFSIVLMEAWLLKKAVLVNERCDVLKEHCLESNGGLYFNNYQDFVECMRLLIEKEKFREKLANNGYSYVRKNFIWNIIIMKLGGFLKLKN